MALRLDVGEVDEHGAARPFDETMGTVPFANCASPSHNESVDPRKVDTLSYDADADDGFALRSG